MFAPRFRSRAALLLSLAGLQPLHAEEHRPVGDSSSALSGIHRVPVVAETQTKLVAAVDAGYGLTESQRTEGVHHRVGGKIALGWVPLVGLEFGMRGGLRYDRHPRDAASTDSGILGDAALLARFGTRLGSHLRIGADASCYFPGSEKAADSLSNPALDGRLLWGWGSGAGIHIAGFGGFRWDRTQGVGSNAPRYRVGDRLALGISDFNALLFGIGAVVPVGQVELLGETTYDLLVGEAAPSALESPIRLGIGVRTPVSRVLSAELLTELALSSRPEITTNSPLIPIEPRIGISIGLRYRLWGVPKPPPAPLIAVGDESKPLTVVPSVQKPDSSEPSTQTAGPAKGRVSVKVLDPAGHPLSDAVVELSNDSGVKRLDFQSGSTFVLDGVAKGRARLTVKADLMRDWSKDVEISEDEPLALRVDMALGENSGQIRGLVRGFDGKPLPALVHIEPGNREVHVGNDGVFSVDVGPGKYRVKIALEGYEPQVRDVAVGRNGVMVLNVDLKKGR